MNLMELFVKIGVDDQASSKVSNITSKIGGGLKTAADIGVKAITAASTAIVGLTGLAIKNYAEYEQLVGGVDTLFKDASQKVQQYAADAYKTSGMSANDYMENATAFSASLISSLGGDTAKAAEYANTAMVSMSDNANKMGTDIESIVATYQSLSRGNMAMLDNLKLGYGGTKAELERLIKDAASYTDVQKEMGLTVDESSMSFDNIVNAIAVVQGHLGIAGATALEASTTIEGSVLSMKAAWDNLVTGIADDNADFEQLIDNFVESAGIAADNLLPRIEIALTGVGNLIETIFPVIMDRIPSIINNTLPNILSSAGNIIITLVEGIIENAPMLLDTAIEIVITLANGIIKALPELVPAIANLIVYLVEVITDPKTLSNLFDAALALVIALAQGLIKSMPTVLRAGVKLAKGVVNAIKSAFGSIVNVGANLVEGLWNGVSSRIRWVTQKMASFGKQVIKSLKNFFGIHSPSTVMRDEIGRFLAEGVAVGFIENDPMSEIEASLNNGVRSINVPSVGMYGGFGRFGGNEVSIIQNIYSQAQTAADLMQEAIYQQEKAVYLGV